MVYILVFVEMLPGMDAVVDTDQGLIEELFHDEILKFKEKYDELINMLLEAALEIVTITPEDE